MRTARILAISAAAAVLAATLTPAQADDIPAPDPSCQVTGAAVNYPEVILGPKDGPVSVDISADVTNCDASGAAVEFGGSDIRGDIYASDDQPSYWSGTIELNSKTLSNSSAGTHPGIVYFYGDEPNLDLGTSMTVTREARLDTNVPSKVKKNKKFYVGGYLERADWEARQWVNVDYKKVRLQEKPSGGKWKTVTTVKSGRGVQGGAVYTHRKVKKSTCFRWVYDGSSTTAAVTSDSDCVKIKK